MKFISCFCFLIYQSRCVFLKCGSLYCQNINQINIYIGSLYPRTKVARIKCLCSVYLSFRLSVRCSLCSPWYRPICLFNWFPSNILWMVINLNLTTFYPRRFCRPYNKDHFSNWKNWLNLMVLEIDAKNYCLTPMFYF